MRQIVGALVNMDEIMDTSGCNQMIGVIKVEGIQFDQSGGTLESFRFTDKNGTQWSVPTNIGKLSDAERGQANSFIRVGKTYYSHIQACGSGGFASLIALYDMSVSFAPAVSSNEGQLQTQGNPKRGWLGVKIQEVTPAIARGLGLPKAEGALVADVTPGGPAEKSGIKQGDVIEVFDGHDIVKVRDLPPAVAETQIGQKVDVKLWRNGRELTLALRIIASPPSPAGVAQ